MIEESRRNNPDDPAMLNHAGRVVFRVSKLNRNMNRGKPNVRSTGFRLGPRFLVITAFALISIFMFDQWLTPGRISGDRTGSVVRSRYSSQGGNETRTTRWLFYTLTDLQRKVENWRLEIDSHDFAYIHNPKEKCHDSGNESEILLVIFVNSAPTHSAKREYVRRTFGNNSAWPSQTGKPIMRIVFLLGAVADKAVQQSVDLESQIHGDIVQETFIDHYLNLTRKTVMGLKWVTNFCRRAKYTMKVDDDILLNTRLLYDILRHNSAPNFTLGTIHWAKPIRSPRGPDGKFYTPVSVYPEQWYPPYFNGHAYILSTDVAERVYQTALRTVILPWSDVFVGGCLRKLGIRLRHSQLFLAQRYNFKMASKTAFKETENAVDIMKEYLSVYHFSTEFMDQIWNVWQREL